MTKREIEIISDALSNMRDWECESLRDEFITVVLENCPTLTKVQVESIFDQYERLPREEKCNPFFNYQQFLEDLLF